MPRENSTPSTSLSTLKMSGMAKWVHPLRLDHPGVPDNGRAFEEVLMNDIASRPNDTSSATAPGRLLVGLLGPQLAVLLDPNQLKATQANTHRPSSDAEGATARDYWQGWLLYEKKHKPSAARAPPKRGPATKLARLKTKCPRETMRPPLHRLP